MAKKVTIDNLSETIADILSEYQGDIQDNINEITKRIGQKGVQALKSQSKTTFDGKTYASGWGYTVEQNRLYTTVIIHNKKQAGLAHLLENGHVKANGTGRYGFYEGVEHIYPVEQEVIKAYESEVVNALN